MRLFRKLFRKYEDTCDGIDKEFECICKNVKQVIKYSHNQSICLKNSPEYERIMILNDKNLEISCFEYNKLYYILNHYNLKTKQGEESFYIDMLYYMSIHTDFYLYSCEDNIYISLL